VSNYQLSINNYQLPEGYKQTEVGVIPEDWEVTTIGDIAYVSSGGTPSRTNPSYWDGSIPWVTTTQIDFNVIADAEQFITQNGLKNSAAKLFPPGTLLMAMYGQGKTRGKVAILGIEATTNQACAAISLSERIEHSYIFHYLISQYESIRDLSNTGNQENLNGLIIKSIEVALPPKEEQRAIAQALSDVDALIAALDQLIAKKRHLKTATMQQLLTGKQRLPGFGGEWHPISMSRHANLKARIGWQALTTAEYLDNGSFFLVTGTDFQNGVVNWSTCHFVSEWRYSQDKNIQLHEGDVLLTKDGTIGKVGYVENMPKPATLNSGVFVIRPLDESFHPRFLYYVLDSEIFDDFLRKIFAGSTISHLYQKDFVILNPLKCPYYDTASNHQ
jgi:type I restriction enzyme S subunit